MEAVTATPAVPAKKPAGLTLIVKCAAEKDEMGMETLLGTYAEMGTNHGRKFFKRVTPADGVDTTTVFLYYWDNRDGADFGGWWFGDQVGGAQVWSRCEQAEQLPPNSGWRIPWDGPVQKDLIVEQGKKPLVVSKEEAAEEAAKDAAKDAETAKEVEDRVQTSTDRVVLAEIEATQALESAHAMLEGEVNREGLKLVEEMLAAQQSALVDVHKNLAAEIINARKECPKAVPALSKLTPRLRIVQASLAQEIQQAKQLFAQKRQEAVDEAKLVRAKEHQQKAEQRDAKALEEALPAALDAVTHAEDLIDQTASTASPLSAETESGEAVETAIKETEQMAAKAQAALQVAKKQVNARVAAARNFATEAKKLALSEYSALQDRLSDASKKLTPLLRVRKEYDQRLEAKQVMTEVSEKMGSVELEVEKVIANLTVSKNPTEDDVKAAEASLNPIANSLTSSIKFVDARLQTAQGALKADLGQMQTRGRECQEKLDSFKVQLRVQLDQLQVQVVLQQGLEKTAHAEEMVQKMSTAEEPFLTGAIESLPTAASTEAISACEEAARMADGAAIRAGSYLKAKVVDIKNFPEESQKAAMEELEMLQTRVEAVVQQVASFKRKTASRKTQMLVAEVSNKVSSAEEKVAGATEAAGLLMTGQLEEVPINQVRSATEQTLKAEQAAAVACAEARKALAAKQKHGQAKESAAYSAELTKLQGRLEVAQAELGKQRKAAVLGERTWKSRQVLQEKGEMMSAVEAEVEKVEMLTTPLGDERPSDDNLLEMDTAVTAVQKTLAEVMKSVEAALQTAQGPVKFGLAALQTRAGKCQEKLDETKVATKEMRQRVACERCLKDARAALEKVDEAFGKVAEVEAPYLKGIDFKSAEEATQAVTACETAAAEVQQAIGDARSLLSTKSLEIRKFTEAVAMAGLQEISALSQKNEDGVQKLTQFLKDTQARKQLAVQKEAAAKVEQAEEAVQKAILAAAPLAARNVDDIPDNEAAEICEKLGDAENEAQVKLDEARRFLQARQRERLSPSDQGELSKLVSRLNNVSDNLSKAKTTASEQEQKFVARMLRQSAADMVTELETELEKTTEMAAPLVMEGGKIFVVASMAKMVLEALSDHMAQKNLTKDKFFATFAKKGQAKQTEFVAFLDTVPDLCSRPDLAFSEDQRIAIFKAIDTNGTGTMKTADFANAFHEKYVCVKETPVTKELDTNTDTKCNLSVGDVVEALGEAKTMGTSGLMRLEVKVVKDGTTGWVTLQTGQGVAHLEPETAYTAFMRSLGKAMEEARLGAQKASTFINQKNVELRDCKQGPLANVKAELAQMRPRVSVVQAKLDQLKKKIEGGKQEHAKREEVERKKQAEKKEKKASSLVIQAIAEKVDATTALLTKVEEIASPLVAAKESALGAVEKPLTVKKQTTEAAAAVAAAAAEALECIKAHEGRLSRALAGPWLVARQEAGKLRARADGASKKASELIDATERACEALTASNLGKVSSALRQEIQKKDITAEKLYLELVKQEKGQDGDFVSQAAFCKLLDTLPGVKIPAEQKTLLTQSESDGISRRNFLHMVERYSTCVKQIAITTEFDIKGSGASVRMLEPNEVVEVVEGPVVDDTLGVTRVRAKAMSDGKTGWVTVKGNHGTPYLMDCLKPFFYATEEVVLQDEFMVDASKDVRPLRRNEVIEVLEGPRKEAIASTLRARGRALKDGVGGWFTVRNKTGQELAVADKNIYTCTSAIALTSDADIKTCKVLRKLGKGEAMTVLEGPITDDKTSVTRIKAQALKDKAEGWVTTKGNAGSVYAEESTRHYVVGQAIALQKAFKSDSAETVRMLEEGEMIEVAEGPREEAANPLIRVRGRAVADGAVGWVTMKGRSLKSWSPRYRCVVSTPLGDKLEAATAEKLRALEVGEFVELLEGPREDSGAGILRIRARAEKDGVTGWVTVDGNQGKPFLECVPAR